MEQAPVESCASEKRASPLMPYESARRLTCENEDVKVLLRLEEEAIPREKVWCGLGLRVIGDEGE